MSTKLNVAAVLVVIDQKLGLKVTEQSGFYRVDGVDNRRVFLAKSGTRVDLSHFTHELAVPATALYKAPATSACPTVLNLDQEEQKVYADLFTILREGLVEGKGTQVNIVRGARGETAQSAEQVELKAAELAKYLPDFTEQ